jgi:hypothetical protein
MKKNTKKTKNKEITQREKVNIFQQKIFNLIDDYIRVNSITVVELVGTLDLLKTFYINNAFAQSDRLLINESNEKQTKQFKNQMFG